MIIHMPISRATFALGAFCVLILITLFFFMNLRQSRGVASTTIQENPVITLTDRGFEPRVLTVRVGSTVTFKTSRGRPFWPASDSHPSHDIDPEFDPGIPVATDGQWAFRFERTGSWGYHDHLRSYFTGTIHVVE